MLFNTDIFVINPIIQKDAWNICDFVVTNEDRLKRYFPLTLAQNLTPELSNIFALKKEKSYNNREEFLFTIKPKDSKKIIGLIYLKELDWNRKQGEFAYALSYDYEGKGIMSKSIAFLSDYAFKELGLETLQIIVYKDNLGSIGVAKKCNYTWIKTLEKEHTPPDENPLDMELYELYKN